MTRYYEIAGVKIAVTMAEDLFYDEEFRLADFRMEQLEDCWKCCFERTEKLLPPTGSMVLQKPAMRVYTSQECTITYMGPCEETWKNANFRTACKDKAIDVQVNQEKIAGTLSVKYALECMSLGHLIARNDGFIFHCSYIDRGGKAILFTAPSETGKSTQADLWAQYRGAEIINGDRAAVRLVDGVLMAEGIPFAGSSKFCKNRSLPIEAVVYLGQAPVTTIRKLRGYEAFSKIWEGVSVNTWDKEDLERVSAVVKTLVETVPVYHMPCTPDEAAVIALENVLIP